jgi:hypothetical protein
MKPDLSAALRREEGFWQAFRIASGSKSFGPEETDAVCREWLEARSERIELEARLKRMGAS